MAEPDRFEMFDASRHRPPAPSRDDADAVITYLGVTRLLKSGRDLWLEASRKAKMVDKARRALVIYDRATMELKLVPSQTTNLQAVLITFSAQQQSATMRLRAAFLHYRIDMLKDSKWALMGQVIEDPDYSWCLRFDLKEAQLEVREKRKVEQKETETIRK